MRLDGAQTNDADRIDAVWALRYLWGQRAQDSTP